MNRLLPTTQEEGMMSMIDGETFFTFTKNTWIGDFYTSSHIFHDGSGLYDAIDINQSVQSSLRSMFVTKKCKLCIKLKQVDWDEKNAHDMACEVLQ